MSSSPTDVARVVVRARSAEAAERAAAEAFEAGALGLEEREQVDGIELLVYAPRAVAERVRRAVATALGREASAAAPEPVPPVDWSERWKHGLQPVVVSPRLVVRPSFAPAGAGPDQAELVIDPGQAFGTGGHESTRLALEWVDALAPELAAGARVLDVGCGTGVLALAALRLAPAATAVALDIDPLAAPACRANARANGLAGRLHALVGGVEALAERARFELVVANLLRSELEPLLGELARRAAPGAAVVLSGLLAAERGSVEASAAAAGLAACGVRQREDASGEGWCALLTRRAPAPASGRAASPGSRPG